MVWGPITERRRNEKGLGGGRVYNKEDNDLRPKVSKMKRLSGVANSLLLMVENGF